MIRQLKFMAGCYRSFRIQRHHSLSRWGAFKRAYLTPYYWICDLDGEDDDLGTPLEQACLLYAQLKDDERGAFS